MPNIPLTLLLHIGILAAGVLALRACGRSVLTKPFLLGLGIVCIYWIVSPLGFWAQKSLPLLSDLRWNWTGKLLVIGAAVAYWRTTDLSRAQVGLTWHQRQGSTRPALAMITLLCALAWTLEAFQADGTDLSTARLLFQGIMPGLDEELVFRGILLGFFVQAFVPGRHIAGASFGWAGVAVTFLFAAGHGLYVIDGEVIANWHPILITGALGAGLFWLRTRTGSLVAPVVAHNLLNFGYSFF